MCVCVCACVRGGWGERDGRLGAGCAAGWATSCVMGWVQPGRPAGWQLGADWVQGWWQAVLQAGGRWDAGWVQGGRQAVGKQCEVWVVA